MYGAGGSRSPLPILTTARSNGDVAGARRAENTLASYVEALACDGDAVWRSQSAVQQRTVMAWRLFAEGLRDQALTTMRSAADEEDLSIKPAVTPGALLPARELLTDMLLEMIHARTTHSRNTTPSSPSHRIAATHSPAGQRRGERGTPVRSTITIACKVGTARTCRRRRSYRRRRSADRRPSTVRSELRSDACHP